MAQATGFSPLSTVPPGLKHEILTHCPDPFTLRWLALPSFSAGQDRIATAVVWGCIHPSVQRAASVAVAASKLLAGDLAAPTRNISSNGKLPLDLWRALDPWRTLCCLSVFMIMIMSHTLLMRSSTS
ncbi:unnamed protein product [Clonostachys chloroleuca]|uniref:Uncharacterized protein n=1 Tax=Clonostachys chloroleuca TaxID=1926264 RepID=A0AA35Q2U5_9HYPO|nr:unnamed protein product [Clonostachys chloroleuca]